MKRGKKHQFPRYLSSIRCICRTIKSLTRIKLWCKLRLTYFSFHQRVRRGETLMIFPSRVVTGQRLCGAYVARRLSRHRLTNCPTGNGVPLGLKDFCFHVASGCSSRLTRLFLLTILLRSKVYIYFYFYYRLVRRISSPLIS